MDLSPWPTFLDDVLAKSADRGGESLARHTADVLEKLMALRELRPELPSLSSAPWMWRALYWTCLLHDFGKAARGFQKMLRTKERWPERHEVLSLLAFDWIAGNFDEVEKRVIVAAIASHHRDVGVIEEKYADVAPDPLVSLAQELDEETLSLLWRWVAECASAWSAQLGFTSSDEPPMTLAPCEEAVGNALIKGPSIIRRWLNLYGDWVRDLEDEIDISARTLATLARGLTTTADHLASAHVRRLEPPLHTAWETFAMRVLPAGMEPYEHQRESALRAGHSALLAAPTGSGKTEAALYWALGDGSHHVPRLFYALPYQASMNAMFDRLRDDETGFGAAAVGMRHGRASQALYARMMADELGPRNTQARVAWEQDMTSMHVRPLTVFSPYQMLKAMFQLRGYEAMLTDYAYAAFIFDEIHAYEPERLALVLPMMKYLRTRYGARFFVMSATFPEIIRERLIDALDLSPHDMIVATDALYSQFRRHKLYLLEGEVTTAGVTRTLRDFRDGKSVLVCANTITRAQEIVKALLRGGAPSEAIELIHGRFAARDRAQREREIMKRCAVGVNVSPVILVATQVVEVSLNIDLDTIYSDPAPLDALLQRFGRVNRRGRKNICPVYVFTHPDDGQGVYGRDKDREERGRIVRVTLDELRRHSGQEIDEAQTGAWLDNIYRDERLRAKWIGAYRRTLVDAENILRDLSAFKSDPRKEEDFERLFDGIDVLPSFYEDAYVQAVGEGRIVDASGYFVNIPFRTYQILLKKGLVREIETMDGDKARRRWMVMLPYSQQAGLSLDPDEQFNEGI